MAKQKFITRTITTISADVMLVNTETEKVSVVNFLLPTYCTTEKLAMEALLDINASPNTIPVKIVKLNKVDKLYRMSEDLFVVYGEEISHR